MISLQNYFLNNRPLFYIVWYGVRLYENLKPSCDYVASLALYAFIKVKNRRIVLSCKDFTWEHALVLLSIMECKCYQICQYYTIFLCIDVLLAISIICEKRGYKLCISLN